MFYHIDYYQFEELIPKRGQTTEAVNRERGIPHFRIGTDRGILISAGFEKVNDAKLRDSRVAAVTLGDSPFVLWNPYDVTLTLIGNTILDKGQVFYIDGNYLGLDSYNKMDKIGIGGYYITSDIVVSITPDEYVTKVKGIWQFNPNMQGALFKTPPIF